MNNQQLKLRLWFASSLFFDVTLIGIGLIGLFRGSFAAIWAQVPKNLPGQHVLVYVCAIVAIATGAGMLVKRTAAGAALALLIYLVIWTIAFKVPIIVRNPLVEVAYQSWGENAVLIATAWVLYAFFANENQSNSNLIAGDRGIRAAYILYGLGLIAFGLSHFFYLDLTAPLVPKWLPSPVFWAYLTGSIYLATGAAIITGFGARLAAAAVALQIVLITLLVWGPMVIVGDLSPRHLGETIESWALTAGALVLAARLAAFSL